MTNKKNTNATIDDRDESGRLKYVQCPECKALMTDIRKTHFTSGRCNIGTKEEFLKKYPNTNLKSEAARANCAVTLENMIKKHGEDLGRQKWKDYCGKQSKTASFEHFEKTRGWTRAEFDKFNAGRATTLENMIRRHGEEAGRKKWDEYCKHQSYAGCTLEYFIETYGTEDGAARYKEVCARKGITLENMLRVHGPAGEEVYHQWLTASRYDSGKSNAFIRELIQQIETIPDLKFHSSENGGEFCIYDKRPYLYDLVITSPIQVCIEFHGDFWHANPDKYKADDVVQHRGGPKLAQDIWNHDALKEQLITNRGYEYMQVWESEYDTDPAAVLEEISKWILQLQQS